MLESYDDLFILPHCEDEIQILQRDTEFLLINKPSRLLSVPGRHPLNRDSVISRLSREYPGAAIVHRLDFDTSGVMVIPLNKAALSHISKQFQARTLSKHYIAIASGIIEQDTGLIDLPIAPDMDHRPKYKICHVKGKPSMTEFRVLQRNLAEGTTRVYLHPVTGRSHQLRLHLSAIGHPIVGCEFYGQNIQHTSSRLLLHATSLVFQHPIENKKVHIECIPHF